MKNVLITGATGGIGNALIRIFYENGYNICATGTNNEKLSLIQDTYKERVNCIKCDLFDEKEIEDLVLKSNEYYGSTNVLVNNAGITKDNLFIRMKDTEWNEVLNLNLKSNFKLTQLIIRDMIKSRWGRIINITSDAAKIGNVGQVNYVASKAAIEGMTRTIANEVASRGITVNSVSPGFINTEILKTVDEKKLTEMKSKIPLGRVGSIEEIANAVYFLSSKESSYITGQVLHVNGGLTM